MSLSAHSLYRGASVVIYDVCCRPDCRGHGPEERSNGDHVVFPRSGVFVKEIAGREFVADPNHVLFFNKSEVYRVAHPINGGDECTVFAFQPALLREVIGRFQPRVEEPASVPFEFSQTPSHQQPFHFQHRLRQRLMSGPAESLMVDEVSLKLLAAVMRHAYLDRGVRSARRRDSTARFHRDLAEQTRLLLAGRYTEDLALEEIARAVHCSMFHLARIFHRETGMAIHQYRRRLRMRAALERLVEKQEDLTALALDLGFTSHSHLSDSFRRAFGVAPSECRRRANTAWLRQMSKNLEVRQAAAA